MSFPQNNNGLPEGSTPINGGGMDGQPPPAPAMQGPPAGQNAANESARTIRRTGSRRRRQTGFGEVQGSEDPYLTVSWLSADGCPEGDGRLPAHGQYNWLVSVDMLLVELENTPGRVNTDEGMIVLPMTRSPGTDEQPASTASRPDNIQSRIDSSINASPGPSRGPPGLATRGSDGTTPPRAIDATGTARRKLRYECRERGRAPGSEDPDSSPGRTRAFARASA